MKVIHHLKNIISGHVTFSFSRLKLGSVAEHVRVVNTGDGLYQNEAHSLISSIIVSSLKISIFKIVFIENWFKSLEKLMTGHMIQSEYACRIDFAISGPKYCMNESSFL